MGNTGTPQPPQPQTQKCLTMLMVLPMIIELLRIWEEKQTKEHTWLVADTEGEGWPEPFPGVAKKIQTKSNKPQKSKIFSVADPDSGVF